MHNRRSENLGNLSNPQLLVPKVLSFKWLQSIPCFAWCQASLSFHLVSSQQGTPHLGCLVHIARPVRTNMSKVRVASMKEMAGKLV